MPPNRVHEIAASLDDPWSAVAVGDSLASALAAQELGYPIAPRPWTIFRAELAEYANLAKAVNAVIVGIVFVMAMF